MIPATAVAWAEFRPDLSDYNPVFSDAILNVEPKPDGYGPLASFSQLGTGVLQDENAVTLLTEDGDDIEIDGFSLIAAGIAERCLGALNARLSGGESAIYAGSATTLYRMASAGSGWSDVSRVDGSSTKIPYSVPDGGSWSMCQYGSRVIACNGSDATQYMDVGIGTSFAALPNAPIAKYTTVVGDFLLFGNLSSDQNAAQWSAVNDSEDYTEGGSDTQSFPDGGPVQGLVGHQGGAIIFQRDKLRLMEWRGDDLVWGFRVIQEQIGCYAPRSIVQARNTFFWYDQGGFYEGQNANPIGDDRVNKWVTDTFSSAERKDLRAGVDPIRNMVWWVGTKSDGTRLMVGYDYILGRWTQSDEQVDCLVACIKPGYSIDDLGALGYTFDTVPYPYDSDVWAGTAELVMAGFTSVGEFGYFEGRAMRATLQTVDMELNPGGEAFLQSARLVSDINYAYIAGTVGTRAFPGGAITWSSEAIPASSTDTMWFRKRGRTHRISVTVDPDDWNNTTGVTVYATPAGGR